jgi:hypothetical protein
VKGWTYPYSSSIVVVTGDMLRVALLGLWDEVFIDPARLGRAHQDDYVHLRCYGIKVALADTVAVMVRAGRVEQTHSEGLQVRIVGQAISHIPLVSGTPRPCWESGAEAGNDRGGLFGQKHCGNCLAGRLRGCHTGKSMHSNDINDSLKTGLRCFGLSANERQGLPPWRRARSRARM